jgi:hypothetical protein
MAAISNPMQLLSQALAFSGSEQEDLLAQLRSSFEESPGVVPMLFPTLVPMAASANTSQTLKNWILDLMEWVICRQGAGGDRLQCADSSLNRKSINMSDLSTYSCHAVDGLHRAVAERPGYSCQENSHPVLYFVVSLSLPPRVRHIRSRPRERETLTRRAQLR